MPPKIDFISEISPVNENWNIVVRVIRLWLVRDVSRDSHPFSLDMILMDSTGNKIHATVRRTLIYRFEKELKEDHVYSMSGFGVASNGGSYRTTKHEYKLNFQFNTKVKICDSKKVPFSIYPIESPAQVFAADYNTDYLYDIMGMLTGVGTQREYERNGVKTKMNAIQLDFDGFKFKVTLFGQYVDELNAFVAAGETENTVVVVLMAKIKIWQGSATVQNSIYSTKLLFNPDLTFAKDLKKRMLEKDDSPSPGICLIQDPARLSDEDDFLKVTTRIKLEGLKDCGVESAFVVLATVKCVLDADEWWYTACQCNKKVIPDEKMYYCSKCNKHVVNVCPRYRIKIRVIDSTDSATFVLFDRDAAKLFKKTAVEMIESAGEITSEVVPEEISSLVDSTFLFKVESNINNDTRFETSYRVRKLTNDKALIEKFKLATTNVSVSAPTDGSSVVNNDVDKGKNAAVDVAQDLLPKFSDTASPNAKSHDVGAIDLTVDSVAETSLKRSFPFESGNSSSPIPPKILKNVKVEKD